MSNSKKDLLSKEIFLNFGPSHPATHGVFHFHLKLDGETINSCETEIGYLHRAFEKHCEQGTYSQCIPYTDRLNYCSAMSNNVGFTMAVEQMMGLVVPERAQWIRMIVCEMSRIMDHIICIGINAVDVGAFTNFLYLFEGREVYYKFIESLCGSRLTTNYSRIGGVSHDLPEGWLSGLKEANQKVLSFINDVDTLLSRNRIFIGRTQDVGYLSPEDAVSYAWTGPCLRSCGHDYDVRKDHPYLNYADVDFEVPYSDGCDVYARYEVRMEEMRQSVNIIEQCIEKITEGPIRIDDPRITMPDKNKVYNEMEAMIRQFKLVIDGIRPEAGEIYSFTESPNGELGFHIVSDGSKNPYRVRCRPPCFPIFSAVDQISVGFLVSDLVCNVSSLNVIAGELER